MSALPVAPKLLLTPAILMELKRITLERMPSEACGLILPTPRDGATGSQVVELPNRSMNHTDSYEIQPIDIPLEIGPWLEDATPEEVHRVAIWHSHPGGSVGPGSIDLEKKIPNAAYLVVALVGNELIPTWF